MKTPNKQKRNKRREGFTLVEIMIVLVIMMTLAAAGILAYGPIQNKAKKDRANIYVSQMKSQLELFRLSVGRFPTTDEGLSALLECPASVNAEKWDGPYIDADRGTRPDPWENPYQYQSDGSQYKVWSLGPDGADGSDDDIAVSG